MNNSTIPVRKRELYETYGSAGPTALLILPAILLCLIASIGILMNSFVVFVTIRTKALHGPTNLLLALLCACEVLHQLGHFPFLLIVSTGINFVDIQTALWIESAPLVGMNAALMAMTCVALDRLMAVLADKIRDRLNTLLYLGLYTGFTILYGIYSFYLLYLYGQENTTIYVTGCITDIMTGQSGKTFFMNTALLCAISALCYLAVWIFVKTQSYVTQETSSRLFKSLVLILCVNIGGYIVNLSALQLMLYIFETQLSISQVPIWLISFVSAILMNCCVAANAPILYLNSSEYRIGFDVYINKICILKRSNLTAVQQLSGSNPNRSNHNNNNNSSSYNGNNVVH